jgi:hypothetical protein
MVSITQPTALRTVIRLWPVPYNNLIISGHSTDNWLVKNIDPPSIQELECEFNNLLHPVCSTETLPILCKSALETQDINAIINQCEIAKIEDYGMFKIIKNGILIMDATKVSAGDVELNVEVPVLIYSPTPVTVLKNDETYTVSSNVKPDKLAIIQSSLTAEQKSAMAKKYYWNRLYSNLGTEDMIDLVLIILEIFSLPILIYGLIKGQSKCKPGRKKVRITTGGFTKREIYEGNKMALLSKNPSTM